METNFVWALTLRTALEALIERLEGNGIPARKKVHELRKLFGDAIATVM
jgi:hypothetical protein